MIEYYNPKISVFRSLFNSKETPFNLNVTEVAQRIKKGYPQLFEKLDGLKNAKTREEYDNIKKTLHCIMFNGVFQERNTKGLIEHSGLCVLDFDKYPNEEELEKDRQMLLEFPSTYLLFKSPSGNGLKAVIRIPKSNAEEHKRRFNALQGILLSNYFDISNKNVDRVCFESYDPDCYLNQEAIIFEGIEKDKGNSYLDSTKKINLPITDEYKIIEKIMNIDLGSKFNEGRNIYCFNLACMFSEFGVNQTTTESYFRRFEQEDFNSQEIERLISSAYKRTEIDFKSRYFEDEETQQVIKNKLKKGVDVKEVKKEHNVSDKTIETIKEKIALEDEDFWSIKKNKEKEDVITINPFKYSKFLTKNGFNKYYPEDTETPTFVRVIENKVSISSSSKIKDFVLNYLLDREEYSVWNHCSKSTMIFSEQHLNMIGSINLKMLKDERTYSYIPFQNGVVKVNEKDIEVLSFIDVEGYIWDKQIINRNFIYDNSVKSDFEDFIKKVCNGDEERIESLETTLGYLIHTYKDKTDQKCIIFNDEEIDENPNGGSGKSLVITSVNNIRKCVKIDGKAFNPNKSDFVYQRVNLDTQILAFDDVKKNFNFEQLFSLITEGISVNRKNKDEIYIPFERSPKIVITTNYVINGAGSSHDRRRHEVEFFQYFNNKHTPLDEYGKLLFDQWSEKEWNAFYNYMITCLQKFLIKGLLKPKTINADKKRLIQSTCFEFYDFVMEENLPIGIRIYNTQIIAKFVDENKTFKDLHTKTFLKWVDEYCLFIGCKIEKDKDTHGRYFELKEINNNKTIIEDEPPF
jgi:hypothetical protein